MPTRDLFDDSFDHIIGLAKQKKWELLDNSGPFLSLITHDSPESVDRQSLRDFIRYAEESLDITLKLGGGGYGCFDMEFPTDKETAEKLKTAILTDLRFQLHLNRLNLDLVRVRGEDRIEVFRAYHEELVLVASNRQYLGATSARDFDAIFSSEWIDEITYGIVTAQVRDTRKGSENKLDRVWRRTFGNSESRTDGTGIAVELEFERLSQEAFEGLISGSASASVLLTIPGYAHSFKTGVENAVRANFRSKTKKLKRVSVMFSWASANNKIDYLQDQRVGELSEDHVGALIKTIETKSSGQLALIAHSHGCKIAIRAMKSLKGRSGRKIAPFIAIQPDVDVAFAEINRLTVEEICERVIIYYNSLDLALRFATALGFGSKLGNHGMDVPKGTAMWEMIDTNEVNDSLLAHSPHIESRIVMEDLYGALLGQQAPERYNVEEVDRSRGRWRLKAAV